MVAQSACVVFSYHPKSEKKKIRFFHKISFNVHTYFHLHTVHFMYLCPSFSLISSFPTTGSGNAKHFDTKYDKRKSCQNTASKKRKIFYKYTTKFSSIQWVSVSLKKFFRNSRCAVGLCNIIVNCQVKIAEVFLSSAVQCTYYLLACFYFCSSKFKFKETHSIYTY